MTTAKPKQPASFAWLVRDTLVSVGVTYLTPEHLRRSKSSDANKNSDHTALSSLLWRALHDLSMVVLADFDIDTVALAMESQALSDDENGIQVCIDVSRYYLYDWGFLCHDFYSSSTPLDVSGPVLLSALAFVLTYGDFFSRQALAIVRIQLACDTVCIPPFPLEPPLQAPHISNAIADAVATHQPTIVHQMESQPSVSDLVHRIHATYGVLQYKLRELDALNEARSTYVHRIHTTQQDNLGGTYLASSIDLANPGHLPVGSVILMDTRAIAERLSSPYILWLLRCPAQLQVHEQALEKRLVNRHIYIQHVLVFQTGVRCSRLSNFADEKLYYQWMVSVVGQVRPSPSAVHHADTSSRFADLLASAATANDHFQSPPNKELYRVVSKQWKDISAPDKAKFKTKMDRAMAKMQQELPTLSALYQPLPKNSTKPPPHDAKKLDEPASPTSLKVATVQDQVDALVALMERRFK
ncbi:hypothetical protein AaE_011355, partial [Aphanomyces astaci]